MLTGLYPAEHGWNLPYLALLEEGRASPRVAKYRSLADYARAAGLATFAETGKGTVSARFGTGKGFGDFREHERTGAVLQAGPYSIATDAREVGSDAVSRIRSHARGRYFAFFHTYDFHSGPGDALAVSYEAGIKDRRHLAVLEWIDAEVVSPVLQALDATGAYDTTLVILTGDHGSNMLRKDRKLIHRGVGHYEENLHVPMVAKFPRGFHAGAVKSDLVRHIDILPTVVQSLRISSPGYGGDGRPLQDWLGSNPPVKASWAETDGHTFPRQSVLVGRTKYITVSSDPRVLSYVLKAKYAYLLGNLTFLRTQFAFPPRDEELYDLASDPWETNNLARKAESRSLLDRARKAMKDVLSRFPKADPASEKREAIDPATVEALRALGYIR